MTTSLGFDLYLVTDRRATAGRPLLETLKGALAGGVRAIELREKDLDETALVTLGTAVRALTLRFGAKLLVNGSLPVARSVRADGVHLPAAETSALRVAEIRQGLGPTDCLVGASSHSLEEVVRAEDAGANFVTFGPVFPTPSKMGYGPPLGLRALALAARSVRIPVLAIGGIGAENVAQAIAVGAGGVACIREILAAPSPETKARLMLAATGEIRHGLGGDKSGPR